MKSYRDLMDVEAYSAERNFLRKLDVQVSTNHLQEKARLHPVTTTSLPGRRYFHHRLKLQ